MMPSETLFTATDIAMMQRALKLAWQGRFTTSPNPRVGCVIAHGEQIVGEGFHLMAGRPHAEVNALKQAQDLAQGATAYVTLEPCSHYGKTPPCALGLIEAGIKRVVAAMPDPNPLVGGRGFAMLTEAGINVQHGLLAEEARRLNRGFLSRIERKRPFFRLKTAASLDGKTALSDGQSQWITGDAAREDVQILRAESCAILTGIDTVLADNPRLTVRTFSPLRPPLRIILDSQGRTPANCHLIEESDAPTLIITAHATAPLLHERLPKHPHIRIIGCSTHSSGRLNLTEVASLLAEQGCGEVLIEAGATLASAFLSAKLIDEIILYQAPKILGNPARGLFTLPEQPNALKIHAWQTQAVEIIGNDIKWTLIPTTST